MPILTFRFGNFEFDPSKSTLKRAGSLVKLQPQPMRVLEMLLAAQGTLVTREQIRLHIWGESTHVDFEQGLNFAIRQIRIALDDTSAEPSFIATVPRQGYKFLLAVPNPQPSGGTIKLAVALSVILLAASSAFFLRTPASAPLKVSKITSLPGNENSPSLSPDGQRIAFSWEGDSPANKSKSRGIFVMLLSGSLPVRLTNTNEFDNSPTWSPDGNWIAFLRHHTPTGLDLVVIPSIGGTERIRFTQPYDSSILPTSMAVCWSPDSKFLLLSSSLQSSFLGAIVQLPFDSGEPTILTHPPLGSFDSFPAISPEGNWLAFSRATAPAASRIMLQSLHPAKGEPTLTSIPELEGHAQSPVWLDHRRTLAYSTPTKIRIAHWNQPPEDLYFFGSSTGSLSAIPGSAGRRFLIAAPLTRSPHGIYTLSISSPNHIANLAPLPHITSSASDDHGTFSPDGKTIAFISNRTGTFDLWAADADGSHARQLTHLNATVGGYPAWSPDGSEILFQARTPVHSQIYRVSAAGGTPRALTPPTIDSITAHWAAAPPRIFFAQGNPPNFDIYSIPSDGGPAERITSDGGILPILSKDGKMLYYAKPTKPGIFSHPYPFSSSSEPEAILAPAFVSYLSHYHLSSSGILFPLPENSNRPSTINFYSFADRSTREIAKLPYYPWLSFNFSPDEKQILIGGPPSSESDILLLEGGLPH